MGPYLKLWSHMDGDTKKQPEGGEHVGERGERGREGVNKHKKSVCQFGTGNRKCNSCARVNPG